MAFYFFIHYQINWYPGRDIKIGRKKEVNCQIIVLSGHCCNKNVLFNSVPRLKQQDLLNNISF